MRSLYAQAQSHIPTTVSLPRNWIKTYEDFVQKNASQVSQIESALRSLTYILPGRFNESELASESLHTTISLLSTYHTSLLPSPSHPTPHTRYTAHQCHHSRLYARTATLLRTIQYTELLCEMFFKRRFGTTVRWRLVITLELIKALCRTLLLRMTGFRMGIKPPAPDQRASEEEIRVSEGEEIVDGNPEETSWKMPRTKHTLSPLPKPKVSIQNYLSERTVSPDTIRHASLLVHRLTTHTSQAAELLYIARPVLYALALQRFQGSKRDWRPWALGLALEILARQLAKRELRAQPGGMGALTGVEREEWGSRGWAVAWWGMRGAFYERVTRVGIQKVVGGLKGRVGLDLIAGAVEEYEWLWDEYYFSTATM